MSLKRLFSFQFGGKKKRTKKRTKKRSLRKSKLLSKKNYEDFIKKRQKKKKLTKKQNKDLDHTLFIKYCKCIKNLKYSKKMKPNLEYPICTSSVYTKRGFRLPKDIKKKCKKYKY